MAASLLLIVLTAVGSLLGTELVNAGATGAESTANGLLTRAMEEIRALPFQFVVDGLSSDDATLATDPNIKVTGTSPNLTYTFVPNGETIPVASPYTQVPLDPHISTTVISGVTFKVAVYPTIDAQDTSVYRVTGIVSWSPHHGVSSVTAQTLVYSPGAPQTGGGSTGCLTDTNHPFAAPCQPFFYSQAGVSPGTIKVSGSVLGLAFTNVTLYGPQSESSIQIEQTTSALSHVKTSQGALTVSDETSTCGGATANSAADNDPGTNSPVSAANTASQSDCQLTVGSLLSTGLSVTPGLLDQGSATSTVKAGSTTPCNDLAGQPQLTGAACSDATVTEGGAAAALSGALSAIGLPLVSWSPSSVSSFAADYPTTGYTYCTNATGDGCVHAAAQRTIGTLELGGLPALAGLVFPTGWGAGNALAGCPTGNYFAALVGYADSVSSESGLQAAAPAGTMAGTPELCFWNGTGYVSASVTLGASPQPVSIPLLSDGLPAVAAVTITPSISYGTLTTEQSTPSACSTVCTASSQISSPIVGSLEIQVVSLGVTLADVTLSVDLGTVQAQTSYQAAP